MGEEEKVVVISERTRVQVAGRPNYFDPRAAQKDFFDQKFVPQSN